MAKLDTVTLFIEKETGTRSVEVTKYPVEKGEPFTDHVKKNPNEFTISGSILSTAWKTQLEKLEKIMDSVKIVKYVGKTSVSNVIILNINDVHDSDIANGVSIDITLRKIRITKNAWEAAKKKGNKKKATATKPKTKAGKKKPIGKKKSTAVYHVIKRGDTYGSLSKKYGTSVAQLRKWNKWPDTKIPVGKKARVK